MAESESEVLKRATVDTSNTSQVVLSPQPSLSQISQSSKQFHGATLLNKIAASHMDPSKKKALANLTKALICSKCHYLYEDPCTIDCSHTFCRDCLEDSLAEALECPTCKIPVHRCDMKCQRDIAQSLDCFRSVIRCINSVATSISPSPIAAQNFNTCDISTTMKSLNESPITQVSFIDETTDEINTSQHKPPEHLLCAETQQPDVPPWSQRGDECSVLPNTQDEGFVPGTLPPDSFLESPSRTTIDESVKVNPTEPTQDSVDDLKVNASEPTQDSVDDLKVNPTEPTQDSVDDLKVNPTEPTQDSVSAALAAFYATGVMGGTSVGTLPEPDGSETVETSNHKRIRLERTSLLGMESQAGEKGSAVTSPSSSQGESECPTPTTQQCNELVAALAGAVAPTAQQDPYESESQAVFTNPVESHVSPFQRRKSSSYQKSPSVRPAEATSSSAEDLGAHSAGDCSTGRWLTSEKKNNRKSNNKSQSSIMSFSRKSSN